MIEQITVANGVHTAIGIETAHVLFHLLAVLERMMQLVNQVTLFVSQAVGIVRIHRGEVLITQRILLPLVTKYTPFKINQMK